MATDFRAELGFENTYKNCVGSIYVPYSGSIEQLSLSERATLYRELVRQQKSPDAVKNAMNMQIGLFARLGQLGTLEEKQEVMAFLADVRINTYFLSYLGRMCFGDCVEYVESTHLYSGNTSGLVFNMIFSGKRMTIDVVQGFASDGIITSFLGVLDKAGIRYTAVKGINFETVRDKAHVTASRQAERYFKNPE